MDMPLSSRTCFSLLLPLLLSAVFDNTDAVQYSESGQKAAAENQGWKLEVLLSIVRKPPVFWKRDETVNIEVTASQYSLPAAADTAVRKPLKLGAVLKCAIFVNGQQTGLVRLNPLMTVEEEWQRPDEIATQQTLVIVLANLTDGEQYDVTLEVETGGKYEAVDPAITFSLEKEEDRWQWLEILANPEAPWELTYPSPPTTGLLATCLRERLDSKGCWAHLRQRLFAAPFILDQGTLALLSMASHTFFARPNDAALRSHFPPSAPPERYKSCGIVGSAGHLANSHLGPHIDQHHAVMRFNEAPTEGFEEHVGRKTTHRIVHASAPIKLLLRQWLQNPLQERLYYYLNVPNDLTDMLAFQSENAGARVYGISLLFVHHAWSVLAAHSPQKIPTSGFVGILWALQHCDEISTYGFGQYRNESRRECSNASPSCASQRRPPGTIQGYRYFQSFDYWIGRGDPGGHNWNQEEALHQYFHDSGFLRRRYDP